MPTPDVAEAIGRTEFGLPRRFGDYELLEEIAHGGMGVVYKARQQIGGGTRLVALKMMLAGGQAAPTIIERFLTEARAAATLEHPHIVPIYDVGAVDGQHYFTMQLMPGGSLQQRLAAGPLPPVEAARLVQRVAEAVQHAHDHGIIHRDIKPHNILLASGGCEPPVGEGTGGSHPPLAGAMPKLADFGLVRTRESGLSVTGEALGTPSYMPPEQARGELQRIGPPSDVYGLGAVLYALLTGRPPFQSADLFQIMKQVCEEEPLPVRQLNPGVPRDLETVCLKCLEKEPGRRYASAAELAEELGRFGRSEPVRARPVGRLERGWRWCKRNPAVAGLLAAVVLVLALGSGVASIFAVQANHEAKRAAAREKDATREAARANDNESKAIRKAADEKKARKEAVASARRAKEAEERATRKADDEARERNRAEGLLYASQSRLALTQWQEGNVAVAREILESTNPERRGWEHRYLYTLFNHLGQRTFLGHTDNIWSVAFSPDGKHIVSGGGEMVKVWDIETGLQILSLKGHTGAVLSVAFSPDGKRIASGSEDHTVRVWDARSGAQILSCKRIPDRVYSVCFSPDGKRIASGSGDEGPVSQRGEVRVWDAQTGQLALTLTGHTAHVSSVAFSRDGKRIASGSADQTVKVWDAQTGQEVLSLKGHTGDVESVCFSPDGKRLASGSAWPDQTVKVWNAHTGQQILTLKGHTGSVQSVAFSPDGQRIASGSAWPDQTVKVWNAQTGQEIRTLKGHFWGVNSVAFSPDGKRIASGSGDRGWGEVKVWDAQTGQQIVTLRGHTSGVTSVAFSPDGKRIASGSGERTSGEVRVWDAQTGRQLLWLKGHTGWVFSVVFSPDGKRIASGGGRDQYGEIKVWDVAIGQETLTLKGHSGPVNSVCFSRYSRWLASASGDKTVKVWEAAPETKAVVLKHTHEIESVAFSPNGKRIASGSGDQTVKVWDAQTGQQALSLTGHTGLVSSLCFSRDGKRIASGSGDQTVKVWDAHTGQKALTLKGHSNGVTSVAFSPDGKRIVSGGGEEPAFLRKRVKPGEVKVWDAHTGQEIRTLKGHTDYVYSVAFSPDGKCIASGGGHHWKEVGEVKVWDAQTGQEIRTLKGHIDIVVSVTFSPDGERVIAKDYNGRWIVWDSATGKQLPDGVGQGTSGGQRSPDGQRFASVHRTTIRLHRLPSTAEELGEARRWVEPDFAWHAAEARASEAGEQWFAAAFHLGRLLPSRPWDADLHVRRAYALTRLRQATPAAIHYLQGVLLNPSARFWPLAPEAVSRADKAASAGDWPRAADEFRLAVHQPRPQTLVVEGLLFALRSARQEELYRQYCAKLLKRHGSVKDETLLDFVAWTLRLGPHHKMDAEGAVRIAERLIKQKRTWWHLETLGVTLYRAGRFAEAVKTLQESIKLQGKGGGIHSWLFLAMAHKQLEHHAQARKWFDQFEQWLSKQQFKEWRPKTEWRLLHQEAKALVNTMPRVAPGD